MKKRFFIKITLIAAMNLFFITALARNCNIAPTGLWQTIDDHSHKAASIVKLWLHNGRLYGKIVKIYPQDGNLPTDVCKHCHGELYNKPIQGMTFLWGLHNNGKCRWEDGKILDPKIGKIYRCRAELNANNKSLRVRGFIGIPLLGRTQIWRKLS